MINDWRLRLSLFLALGCFILAGIGRAPQLALAGSASSPRPALLTATAIALQKPTATPTPTMMTALRLLTPTPTLIPTTPPDYPLYLPVVLYQEPVLLRNGDFEQGSVDWHEFSSGQYRLIFERPELLTVSPHGGKWAAWLGGKNDELSELSQQVTVPIGEPVLRYWYQILAEAECGSDNATLLLDSIEVDQFAMCNVGNIDWTPRTIDLSRYVGLTVTLIFRVKTDDNKRHSNLYLDDIGWVVAN